MRSQPSEDTLKNVEWVPIDSIKPNNKNRNIHPQEQIDRLVKIIQYQGWRWPIVVWKSKNEIQAGHGRWLAAKSMGLEKVPVSFQEFESDEQAYAFLVSDNAVALWAELDLSGINTDIGELGPEFDIDLLGIKDFMIEVADKHEGDPDDVPEAPAEPKTRLGDIYQLGAHRLMCGDSTSIDAVEKLMNGQTPDITFTSPPYNAAKNGHLTGNVDGFDKKYNDGHSDELTDDEYLDLLAGFTSIAIAKTRYAFVNLQLLTHNRNPLLRYQAQFQCQVKDILIWNKNQCPPNIVKGAFNTKWEYVFVFSNDTRTRGFPCEWQGKYPNVVETESNSGNEFAQDHKAGFPIAFPSWFIEKLEFVASIYDPFCGTGTTLIAAEKYGRTCFGMELDPIYCDVIVARWEQYTGRKAELITQEAADGTTAT